MQMQMQRICNYCSHPILPSGIFDYGFHGLLLLSLCVPVVDINVLEAGLLIEKERKKCSELPFQTNAFSLQGCATS
jgi:hypothetical protein